MLPIEFTEVTITRTLFRSGDSEYAINGVPCRLLDIQDLLSDSGVGRQQHVIISQGQIDAVLNARPEERRLIIEEAAGRPEVPQAARRSPSAAWPPPRPTSPGSRTCSARCAASCAPSSARPTPPAVTATSWPSSPRCASTSPGASSTGCEPGSRRARRRRAELREAERRAPAALAELDTLVMATEAELSAMGGDDLGDALVRFESLCEQARGLAAVLAERRRGIERDRGLRRPGRHRLARGRGRPARRELAEVDAEARGLAPLAEELAVAEAALAAERDRLRERWADGVPAPSGAAAEVRGELAALRAAVERGRGRARSGC